jgi:hypothetical protein
MARPISEKALTDATSAGAGEELSPGGRITFSLFVVGTNLDTGSDTLDVRLEASMDGENWSPMGASVSASDFEAVSGSEPAAYTSIHGYAARYVRPSITSFNDSANGDLTVTAYVGASSNPSTTHDYREA